MVEIATQRCPYCAEDIRAEAIKCRYCGSAVQGSSVLTRAWHRSARLKMIAGVCAGLAEEFGISVTILRLAFVLGALISGTGLIIYIVLWVVMPLQRATDAPTPLFTGSSPYSDD
jgi:phage shock protein PspC (stress-responsive transcriptional regulator)